MITTRLVSSAKNLITDHIIAQYAIHRQAHLKEETIPPLIVGLQGPQGSGKTYLTSLVDAQLKGRPDKPSVVTFSLDDLYLTHAGLVEVAQKHPGNPILQGRGLPGTHDIELAQQIFTSLLSSGRPSRPELPTPQNMTLLPRFLKSLQSGQGDRLPPQQSTLVQAPVDIVLFEGWCLGFRPLGPQGLDEAFASSVQGRFRDVGKDNLGAVETELGRMVDGLWGVLNCFVQLSAPSLETIYTWRQQQEVDLQSRSADRVMSPEEVIRFVDRYMPAYELWSAGVRANGTTWAGKGLGIVLGQQREVVGIDTF
ncbi:Predicted kinase [Phaffia rhodozyma]|uniref:Predicted kinase n=1 Tax=Phaffia rhodozyma TaxID=264483 RepID=A0A0F7SJ25_PHARH|nr:Predicted kinase [Phaffia rhodozyma]